MKIENLEKAKQLVSIVNRLKHAIEQIDKLLERNESDGRHVPNPSLYSFSLSEHKDGSGIQFELTGGMITKEVLKLIKDVIIRRLAELEAEINLL